MEKNVWVLRNSTGSRLDEEATMVRADTISYVRATVGSKIVVADLASQEVVTVVDEKDGLHHGQPRLPPRFHLDLMAKLTEARVAALRQLDDEDRFVIAEVNDGKWAWVLYKLSELPQD
ncbi:hypothetical protein QMK19_38545 [Streptomyces sp. H10-C2]|uniref:hypothetical protein n=1 Tax=unclassified Streptomyces TaxID=2593676 RepID=UPI0024BA7426|nr:MULTISPECIES: hypothetical protein [unclassified Streptomyces]MDJ0347111.1 hypothetical protein [Streptomyces sp. PH10-H1]MDJ0375340.1 hypothetical protein [Streptomyces sp. H10-C2]